MENFGYEPGELFPVFRELAGKYMGNEHTSITYEKAQELMEAVLYCIGQCYKEQGEALSIGHMPAKAAWISGCRIVEEKIKEAQRLYNEMIADFDDFGMVCLDDTVRKGLPQFFLRYDHRFCPQDTLLTLDYPVLSDIRKLCGIDAILEYIRSIRLEQIFLASVDRIYVQQVLLRYHRGYRNLFENICALLLPDLVGHLILKKSTVHAGFTDSDLLSLSESFSGLDKAETETIIQEAITRILSSRFPSPVQEELFSYLSLESGNLAVRIHAGSAFH